MNDINQEKTMTIKEIAEVFKVSESSIHRSVDKLFPEIKKNGITTRLNEMQVTAIKLDIERHHNLVSTEKLPKTELEKRLIINQAFSILQEDIKRLEKENELMKPKALFYDQVTGSKDTVEMKEVAKLLNMGIGRNNLFKILREKKILDRNNQPYQQYVDLGYFRIVETKYIQN